jgi:hypothetical protein
MTLLVTTLALLSLSANPDYQKLADDAKWEWKDERATAAYSAKNLPDGYKAEVDPKGFGATIRFSKDDKEVAMVDGHEGTVFLVKDGVLYYADYGAMSTGYSLVARDLSKGKDLWKVPLKGLGPIRHFKYQNAVALDIVDGALRILGHESAGNYIEFVDMQSGKTVGHKVFGK